MSKTKIEYIVVGSLGLKYKLKEPIYLDEDFFKYPEESKTLIMMCEMLGLEKIPLDSSLEVLKNDKRD